MAKRWGTITLIAALAVIAAGAVLAVVKGGGSGHSDLADGGATASKSSAVAPVAAGGSPAASADRAGAPDASAPGAGPAPDLGALPVPELRPQIVKQASVELEVGRHAGGETVRKVIDAVGVVHGYIESSDLSGGRSRLTVRVPADDFDATLDRILGLGHRRDLQVHGQDVTGAVTDLEARLRNLRAQEAVLLSLMGKAGTIGDSIAVQQQLSQNQEAIEQLDGQRRALADQTSYATLTVSIAPTGAESSSTLSSAWSDGVDAALAVTGGTLVVLGALLPVLVLAGLGLLGRRVVASRRRRARPPVPATR